VVLSRRSMLEEEARKTRAEALANLKIGEERDGIVRSVVPFGAGFLTPPARDRGSRALLASMDSPHPEARS